jgi:hypothetical protein
VTGAGDVLDVDARALSAAVRAARNLPADLRAELRRRTAREVVAPVARQVQLAAGASGDPFARLFRSRGVTVRPGDEPILVVGGPERIGDHGGTLRAVVKGAEFGGGRAFTTYLRRSRGTRRRAPRDKRVRRRATVEFGPATRDGTFVYPTILREVPATLDRYARILADVADKVTGHG